MTENYTSRLRLLWHTVFALQEAQRQYPKLDHIDIPCSYNLEDMLMTAIEEELNLVEAVNHAS